MYPFFISENETFILMSDKKLIQAKKALGLKIAELRKKVINPETNKPISQEELGLRTGNAKKTIGEIERGNTNPTFETLFKIANELQVSIAELFQPKS
ncbi:helix-turn-helix domain-containing protein [Zunongwangia endophytica]|uniref:Helix-turn-helix domain-containing protein n=2 Tax=Zunongwangia endophytica TaxID=1808945 RepID=A0ABV8H6Y8_9FLAO|nr:helix-turn-helix transcriptional regulator [Zunongwangia endophytica]MDN3595985.1 helix-turn-helix transcriptional regulator [Zunongwangia endophytica]